MSANTTVVFAQSTTGELFFAPPPSAAGANNNFTNKPILSVEVTEVSDATASGLEIDRQLIGWDNGFVDGTAGNDSIGASYVEPVGNGSDKVDGGDGISGAGTAWHDDRIRAGAGNDTINGSLGNDSIDAGTDDDQLQLTGTYGNDTVDGGAGRDTLTGPR